MKRYFSILLFTLIGVITTVLIWAQFKNVNEIIPESKIKESIRTFSSLLDSEDVQEFGFKSVDELKSMKGGKQFRKYVIGLDEIRNYKLGQDVSKIIKEYPSIEVALVNGTGAIRTSIEFVKNEDKWESAGYGSTPEFVMVQNAQAALGDSIVNKGILIRIPALQINFLANPSPAGLEFIILEDNINLKFKKGEKVISSEAIIRLIPLANRHNGLPN